MSEIQEGAFEEIACFESLYDAFLKARKRKRGRLDVALYTYYLEQNLIETEEKLKNETYRTGEYHRFFVSEPKKRLVMSLRFEDRVVQWSIYKKLYPFYDKQFIKDSYGCRLNKGTQKAAERLQYWLRQVHRKPGKWYYLKLDISKYFYRVDHAVLLKILSRKIKDEKLMRLLERIINGDEAFGLPQGKKPDEVEEGEWLRDVGMPIGNLTSQLFANIYLNELDQYCKHILHLHYYVRYVDDVIILGNDKKILAEVKREIEKFLNEELKLDLNGKTAIRPVDGGIDFVGFVIWGTHKKIKKQTAKRMKRSVQYLSMLEVTGQITREAFMRSMSSYNGILEHCNSEGMRRKLDEIYLETRKKYRKEDNVNNTEIFEVQCNLIRELLDLNQKLYEEIQQHRALQEEELKARKEMEERAAIMA